MSQQLDLNNYKRRIADLYDRRSRSYDSGELRLKICRRLIEYSQISSQQHILDIGTGTGNLAIESAEIVGAGGKVIGVDISTQMLDIARDKIKVLGLNNVEFQLADAEELNYPTNSFDRILCANTFPWMENKPATLRIWNQFLKPGGVIAIHTPADTAYIGQVILRSVLGKYGIKLKPSNRIGSIETCKKLFVNAGFEEIDIKTEQHGGYVSLDSVISQWEGLISFSSHSNSEELLSQLSSIPLAEAKTEFEAKLDKLHTKQGIWDDLTTLYIVGRKSEINKPV
ncbi:MAG: methyltransferase domain-containing protein [Rivularia sp. ALOHA_DT_140]|nr:methyltransferase domain-containing protein [Rivularia sp. ALOHA_DT_140]